MFKSDDEKYLIRHLSLNKVVLFLGAGFSVGVQNRIGSPLPSGDDLAKLLWEFLEYEGEYDRTSLATIYGALIAGGKKTDRQIGDFINTRLLCDAVPDEYSDLSRVYWHRIYTTNIDNVIEKTYVAAEQALDIISYPTNTLSERDQSLAKVQLICLHGKYPCKPNEITFSEQQYARRANAHDALYNQFIGDYVTHPTIFIGTQLNESLFWQYIEMRDGLPDRISENRKKSFLIAPRISQPRKEQLRQFNVVPIEGTTSDFLSWIKSIAPTLPSRIETLEKTVPDIALAVAATGLAKRDQAARIDFSARFQRVPIEYAGASTRSRYLLGATPDWQDILSGLDAPREITKKIETSISEALDNRNDVEVYALLGSAGCGKSTILHRLGLNLARTGHSVYLTNSEELPKHPDVLRALDSFSGRSVLLFDNAEIALSILPTLASRLANAKKKPIIVIAARTNDFDRKITKFPNTVRSHQTAVPTLTRAETEQIISTLDKNNLLGKLQGMTHAERLNEFEIRSKKQVLVAMREATSGQDFDLILENEFENLVPHESKILYLCVALATAAGYRITKAEFVGCSQVKPAQALHILERNLRDIVVSISPDNDLLMLRHKAIAECAIDKFAPRALLKEAYVLLLTVLAPGVIGSHWSKRSVAFYKSIINHQTIYSRFENDIDQARPIYESLSSQFKKDAQFWLQYGSLELEGEDLDYAENHLKKAESLKPADLYIQTAKGHLLLKQSIKATTKSESITLRDAGSAILLKNMESNRGKDPYTYHIYGSQRYSWMKTWIPDHKLSERIAELDRLRMILKEGVKLFPHNRKLNNLSAYIEKEYLLLAVSR